MVSAAILNSLSRKTQVAKLLIDARGKVSQYLPG